MPRILRVARILCVCVWLHGIVEIMVMKWKRIRAIHCPADEQTETEIEGVRETKRGRNEEREAPKQTPKVSGMKGEPPKKKRDQSVPMIKLIMMMTMTMIMKMLLLPLLLMMMLTNRLPETVNVECDAMRCHAMRLRSRLRCSWAWKCNLRPGQARINRIWSCCRRFCCSSAGLCLRAQSRGAKKPVQLAATIVIKSNANQNDKYLGRKQLGKK